MEFALLVEQMDDMRSYLRTVWTRYTARTVDLTAAALATNTAQELVQQMISDFENKFKETTMDFKQLTSGHFRMCCEAEGLPYNEGDQTWDDETYRAAENSYYFVYSIVVQYTKDDPTLKGNPKQQDEKRAKAKAMQPWIENIRQRPGFDKAKADASLLMESLGGLFSPFEGARRPTFDEDYRRLRKTLRDGVVFLDSAFAAQVSLDISSIIEGQADRPPQELERQLNVVQAGINSYLGSHKDLHNTNLTPVQIDSMVKIWDLALAIRQSLAEGRLFRKSTVLIGMLVLFFRHTYFQIGWNVANCWHYITFCAHIVNAMGVSGIQKNWLDMKCAQLGLKRFFPGEKVPRDGGGVKRSFLLNCGLSSTTFATGGVRPRNDSEMFSKSGARPLIDSAKIHKKFCVDSLTKGLREPYTLDQLEQVIEESPGVSDDLYDKETRNLINELEAERTKKVQTRTGGSTNNNRGGSSQKKRSVACPERAIERLLQAIQYENTIVKFPYLDLHCKCLHVLRDMVHHCGPALPGNGDDYHAKGNHFGVFAAELLERTFGSEHLHANTRPMELATEALEEHIQNEGTTCCFEIMRSLQGMGTERGTFNWDLENNKGRQLNGFSLKEGSLWHDDISFRTDIVIRDGNGTSRRSSKMRTSASVWDSHAISVVGQSWMETSGGHAVDVGEERETLLVFFVYLSICFVSFVIDCVLIVFLFAHHMLRMHELRLINPC
mgnify:CR=1 FL=1